MFKPQELEKIPLAYNKIMRELEEDIIVDIANRILETGEITSTADWKIFRLHQLGKSKWWIKRRIKKACGITRKEINSLYKETFKEEYARNAKLYKFWGSHIIPFDKNESLQQTIDSAIANSNKQLDNLTRTSGFSRSVNGKKQFTDVHVFFTSELDKSFVAVQQGLSTADKEAIRVVKQMLGSGYQTVYYDSGAVRSAESCVRACIMTGITQVTAKQSESNAEQLGTDLFEVSYHSTARPSHQEWQGRVWSKEQLSSVCGFGTVTGLCGINCYHTYYPFIEGVSERTYTDAWLDEQNKKANQVKTYKSVEYTQYEATQRMRYIERRIRQQTKEINVLSRLDNKDSKEIQDSIAIAKCKKKALSQAYTRFADKMDLPQERHRINIIKERS